MHADIEQHPDYPFRPGRRELLEGRRRSYLDGPEGTPEVESTLGEFVFLSHCFAFLERLIQGELICNLPAHAGQLLAGAVLSPEEQGERLAEAEVGLLDWTPGSDDQLDDVLDETGLKVFTLDESEGSDEVFGAFAFEPDVGPTLLAGAPGRSSTARFVLAHEYAHLVADVDPYLPRFCRWDAPSLENHSNRIEEVRADRFARSLLMPAERFRQACAVLGLPARNGADEARPIGQLAVLFDVPETLVRRRLHDLGLAAGVRPGDLASDEAATPARVPAEPIDAEEMRGTGRPVLSLPERYVNLALAAYAGRVLDLPRLARFLRTDEGEAARVVEWAQVRPDPVED